MTNAAGSGLCEQLLNDLFPYSYALSPN